MKHMKGEISVKDSKKEKLLRSWDPSKESEKFKERLWREMEEYMESYELDDDELDMVAGGIAVQDSNKGILEE